MRILKAFIIFIFIASYLSVSYGADDRKLQEYSPQAAQYEKPQQDTPQPQPQQSRPILPPVIPATSSGISPTPSPNISAPSIATGAINVPGRGASAFSTGHIPSGPAHVAAPSVPFQPRVPQVPIIGSTTGKVVSIGKDTDGTPWIEVKDMLLNRPIRIKLKNLKNIPIVKEASIMRFEDIKIENILKVLFSTEGEENIAHFISFMTEEETEALKKDASGQLRLNK